MIPVFSYDFWDTLFGRWYYTPESIFHDVYKEKPLMDFVNRRIWSEHHATNKKLPGIYEFYAEHFKEDEIKLKDCMYEEMNLESIERCFPIYDVISELKTPYILVSDFYFDRITIASIFKRFNITPPIDYFIQYDGKSSGNIWKEIKKKYNIIEHWGDNPQSDFMIARTNGVNGNLYEGTKLNETEKYLGAAGFQNLSYFLRMLRLSNPYRNETIGKDLWNEQVYNVGVLILFSQLIHKHAEGRNILFTERDCNLLYKLYSSLFPDDKIEHLYTSRDLYLHPTESFITYTNHLDVENSLIIDLQGTGESCYHFFHSINRVPSYYTLIDSDREHRAFINKSYVVRWIDNFTDKIEKLNYSTEGRVIDVGMRAEVNPDSIPYINIYHNCFKKALDMLDMKFDLDLTTDYKSGIIILLRQIEKKLKVEGVIRHDET